MTNNEKIRAAIENAEALEALQVLYCEAARMGEYHGSGLIKDCFKTIHAALNQPRTAKIDGLREMVEKLDKAGSWMSAAQDCEHTCTECKADFAGALEAIETLRAQLAAQGDHNG